MSEQVHIRVGETRHEKWVDCAEAEYDGNMSKLIRGAVEKEISGTDKTGTEDSQAVEANGRIDDILNGVEDNGTALEAIQSRLDRMHEQVAASGGVSDTVHSDVFGALVELEAGADPVKRINRALTPTDIAEKAGVSIQQAESALAQMRREYDDVGMVFHEEHDEPRYWKEV